MSNAEKVIARYQLILRIKVIMWWFIDTILIFAVIGWTLDLLTGIHPFPSIAVTLIFSALLIIYLCGIPSKRKILNKHKRKGGFKAELANTTIDLVNHKAQSKKEELRRYHNEISDRNHNTYERPDE